MEHQTILNFAQQRGYDSIKKLSVVYYDYEVYEPTFDFDGVAYVGLPLCILVKGDNIRMTTPDEAMELLKITSVK